MSLNPGGAANFGWNYSKQDRDGFSLELYGTIVALQEVQAREFNMGSNQPGRPRFWPDGNPVMNIRVGLATPDGSLKSITFQKAGKKQISGEKPSLHMQLYRLTNGNMMELMGKTIHIWTWPANPNTNQPWGQGNPRLFGVEEVPDAHYELTGMLPDEFKVAELYCNDAVQGGQPTAPAPQQMQVPQVPQMQGQFYAAPTVMQQQPQYMGYQSGPMTAQPMMQQPMQPVMQQQQMPATQTMPPQQAQPAQPQGMDPAVAAAMQAVGAINVQEVTDTTGGVYEQDIPF